ncbi:MAG TPA: H-NS histone family protein [Oleiagrimonas sp.]|nr:H-NS histone family protein [Oleiagrimonas sp.]
MAVDISNLNQKQLNDLINKAESRKKEIHQDKVVKLRKKINDMIKAEGYTFEDIFGARRKTRRSTGKVPPKYANPSNPSETWSGRGKRPRWFNAAIKAGKKEKDLLIK